MVRRIHDAAGVEWEVGPSGHRTQYSVDEFTLEFIRLGTGGGEKRYARFSPRGAKAQELALEELSEAALKQLLVTSQPAWTSPDGGYPDQG